MGGGTLLLMSRAHNAEPAADAGSRSGDVIVEVNRQPVDSVSDYRRALRRAGNQSLVLLVNRNGNTTFVLVEPEQG